MSGWVFEANESSLGDLGSEEFSMGELIETAHPMERGLGKLSRAAEELGLATKEQLQPLEMIGAALMLTSGAFMAYNALQGLIVAASSIENALAAAEASVAAVDPATWLNLALAGAAAAAVYAGVQVASGQWQLPAIDISVGSQRAQAQQAIKVVSGNGY